MQEVTSTPQTTTLTSLLETLSEIESTMEGTKNRLEFACDDSQPNDIEKSEGNPTVSLAVLQRRISTIARLANRTSTLSGNLLG